MSKKNIPFRHGRIDFSGLPAFNAHTVSFAENIVEYAAAPIARASSPLGYLCTDAKQVVPLTSVVLDFSSRLRDYDGERLITILRLLREGAPLPALSVLAEDDGTYSLENGYHRFLACALLDFVAIPIDQPPVPDQPKPQPIVTKAWVPRHRRGEG